MQHTCIELMFVFFILFSMLVRVYPSKSLVIEVANGDYGEICGASAGNMDMRLFCKCKWRRVNVVPTTKAHSTMPVCAKNQRYSIMVR